MELTHPEVMKKYADAQMLKEMDVRATARAEASAKKAAEELEASLSGMSEKDRKKKLSQERARRVKKCRTFKPAATGAPQDDPRCDSCFSFKSAFDEEFAGDPAYKWYKCPEEDCRGFNSCQESGCSTIVGRHKGLHVTLRNQQVAALVPIRPALAKPPEILPRPRSDKKVAATKPLLDAEAKLAAPRDVVQAVPPQPSDSRKRRSLDDARTSSNRKRRRPARYDPINN